MPKKTKKAASKLARVDRETTHRLAKHRDEPIGRLVGVLKEAADQPQLIAAATGTIVIGLVTRRRDLIAGGTRMLASHLVATGVKAALKASIDRSRPRRTLADGEHHLGTGKGGSDSEFNSFPSGHTAGAVAVALAASRDIDGVAAPAALGVGAIAAAQPATGAHYLSDVIAGGVIGWLSEAAVSAAFDRIKPRIDAALASRGDDPADRRETDPAGS